jgi:hypothetical protein
MLAAVLKEAASQHIRVIGVVHVLAWRFPGSGAHWLAKRADLLDTDAAGLTRRAWWRTVGPSDSVLGGASGDLLRRDPFIVSDFVRPDIPEVRTRLLGLMAELRRYKGLSGVALADWTRFAETRPGENPMGRDAAAPSLGYSLAARVAFLAANGVDPLDIASRNEFSDGPAVSPEGYNDKWNAVRFAEDRALADVLLARIRTGWPGHAALFDLLQPDDSIKLPAADVTIAWEPMPLAGTAICRRVTLPNAPVPQNPEIHSPPLTDDEARRKRLDEFNLALHEAAPSASASGIFHADGVIFDFMAAPDLMWDGLKLLLDAAG